MTLLQQIKNQFSRFTAGSPAIKASMAYMFCTLLQKGISTLTTPIFTRLLTTEQYGYYSIFHSWLAVIKIFSTLLLAETAYTQALVKFPDQKHPMTSAVAGLGTMTTLIVSVCYFLFREQFNALTGADTFLITCILITAWEELIFDLWAIQQRVSYWYKPLLIITVFTTICKPALGICAVLATDVWKAQARIIASVAVDVLAYSGFFLLFIKRGKSLFNKRHWRYFLSFSIPLIPHYLTRIILNQSDRLMIQTMVGYSEAGIYALAHSLAWLLTLISHGLLNTVNPWVFQKLKARDFAPIAHTTLMTSALVACAGLGLTVIAPEIVSIFAPPAYHAAIWIIPPLVASVFFQFIYSIFIDFEYYYETKNYLLAASIPGGLLNIVLNYLFIPRFGYLAAGYTTLACYSFMAVTHYYCVRIIMKKKENDLKVYALKPLLLLVVAFLLASAVCMLTYPVPLLRYALLTGSAAILFLKRDCLHKLLRS